MGREGRDYWEEQWEEQLSEYWDSGLTIQEYSELKDNVRKIAHILIWVHGIRKEALHGF